MITTPGVAFLARSQGFDAGIVISASHNPWTDNGIKVFSGDGYKLPDARELAIEKEIFALLQNETPAPKSSQTPRAYLGMKASGMLTFGLWQRMLAPICRVFVLPLIARTERLRPKLRNCSGH